MGGRRRSALWGWRVLVASIVVAVIAGVSVAIQLTQNAAREGLTDGFEAQAALAAKFVATFNSQTLAREATVATATLSGSNISAPFASDVSAFGFQAAVLLDSGGRALAVAPEAPAVIGKSLGPKYAHLASALAGHPAVSNVVPSAAESTPIVAFAAPYQTPFGRRVFSGAYAIRDTPLAAFLDDTNTLAGAHLYLVDANGIVVASNGKGVTTNVSMSRTDSALHIASSTKQVGSYRLGSTAYTFAKTSVPNTSWSLLIAVPSSGIYVTVNGSSHWGPWLILAGLAALAALAGWLGLRLAEGRQRLRWANELLGELARTDPLTGLPNRRHLTERLAPLLANVRRQDFPLCVLMIDIDHFKTLNDTYGHQAGDTAIRHIAERLASTLREGDLIARWGGEEFLAVLPATNLAEALLAAERLRQCVESTPLELGDQPHDVSLVAMAISIGVAEADTDTLEELIHRADRGLYEAKASGRNSVRASV